MHTLEVKLQNMNKDSMMIMRIVRSIEVTKDNKKGTKMI